MFRLAALIPFFSLLARAAEEAEAHAEPSIVYKWINFGILIVALIYLIAKFLMPVLKARSSSISNDIAQSKATVKSAEEKVSALTSKLTNFEGEIRSIREKAMAEREIEAMRISEQSQILLAKVSSMRETEIGNLTQAAQSQLRALTVEQAITIAHARLAAMSDPATQSALVTSFVDDLKRQEAR